MNTNAQSKEETQQWIKLQIESIGSSSSEVVYGVSFNEEGIMLINSSTNFSWSDQIVTRDFHIPLKSLSQNISYETIMKRNKEDMSDTDEPSFIYLHLRCIEGSKCFQIEEDNQLWGPYNSKIKLALNLSVRDDNMMNRLKKALIHLIDLNGGEIVKEDTF